MYCWSSFYIWYATGVNYPTAGAFSSLWRAYPSKIKLFPYSTFRIIQGISILTFMDCTVYIYCLLLSHWSFPVVSSCVYNFMGFLRKIQIMMLLSRLWTLVRVALLDAHVVRDTSILSWSSLTKEGSSFVTCAVNITLPINKGHR